MRSPLEGITVVSLEQAISAPLCTRHLADLGARVIKVENPTIGDSTRHYDRVVNGMAAHFVWLNYGKESAALDLTEDQDFGVLTTLLNKADVFVSNLAPGALARLGLAPDDLGQRHPELIIVDISGYGPDGPYESKRAYDLLIQSETGSCSITGWPGQPAKPGIPLADVGTALYAYSAILAALYDRERTGKGALVPIAMLDVVGEMMGFALNQAMHAGVDPVPVGMGSPMVAPYGAYATSGGSTVVLGTTSDREWRRLATQMLDRPELVEDARFARNADRCAHRSELDEMLTKWCADRTLDEITSLADAAGIGNARLNTVSDFVSHEQLEARRRWRGIDTPAGEVQALVPPALATSWQVRSGAVPSLGEHTTSIRDEVGRGAGNAGQ